MLEEIYQIVEKYYPHLDGENIEAPLIDLAHYVVSAWRKRMEWKEACEYGGSKLLFSLVERSGRRWASSVQEANEVFDAGKKAAIDLWGLLEEQGEEGFWKEVGRLIGELKSFLKPG